MLRKPIPLPWLIALITITLAWYVLSHLLTRWGGESGWHGSVALALGAILLLLLTILYRVSKLLRYRELDDLQTQYLTGIYEVLKPIAPLPPFRKYAISPDLGVDYLRCIRDLRPEMVVELGSGTSTVIAGYQLKRNGIGRVIAVEHQESWAKQSSANLREHGLDNVAEVRHSPLTEVNVEGHTRSWYSTEALDDIERIDILLIDGPYDSEDSNTRYPALPMLCGRLSEKGIIIVDDCVRPNWYRTVVRWARQNGFKIEEPLQSEKRHLILSRERSGVSG